MEMQAPRGLVHQKNMQMLISGLHDLRSAFPGRALREDTSSLVARAVKISCSSTGVVG